jgi:2-polyprenyl-6-methoxyphenol hydroxylase-like FAD-dependent oxidoreductase
VSRTALIVGAGIGGLSAGIALRKAGWDVRIFERAASARELGFGLLLAPNAMVALGELGVGSVVSERGWPPTRAELRRLDGTVIKRAEFPPPHVLGGPTVVALRAALHGALLDAVGESSITLGHEAVGFEPRADGRVAVRFANGGAIDGDVLIGADGARSAIRRALHPAEGPPRPSGIVAVRGGVHGQVRHLGDLSVVYYMDRGVEAFTARASDTGIYWALSLAETRLPSGLRDPAAVLAHMLPHLETPFRAILSATTDMRCDELVDRDPIPFWSRGRVTLLGDAAHPLLPHTGQGAAQAIVDAVTLGRLLAGDADVEPALQSYERERRPKTTALLGQGRRTARLMRMTNPVACYAREIAVRLIPVKPMVKLLARINRRAGTAVRGRARTGTSEMS